MATYWVPDLTNIKGFSGHLWRSILIFANGTLCAWSSKHIKFNVSSSSWPRLVFFELKITNILKSSGLGLEKSELPWEQNFFYSRRCVSCRTIRLPSFNGLCSKLAKIALFVYLILYWVECMTSSVILFAYFTHFSNLNISLMWLKTVVVPAQWNSSTCTSRTLLLILQGKHGHKQSQQKNFKLSADLSRCSIALSILSTLSLANNHSCLWFTSVERIWCVVFHSIIDVNNMQGSHLLRLWPSLLEV